MYLKPLLKTLTRALKSASPPSVQSTAASSIAKLMLTNTLQDSDLLKTLVVAYFDPATRANAAMRQALSYFLPVYCHSRYENQERMGSIAVAVVHSVMGIADDLDDEIDSADEGGKSDMVGLTTVVAMLADWTDGRKLVRMAELNRGWEERPGTGKSSGEGVSSDVQLDIVGDVLEKVLRGSCSRKHKTIPSLSAPLLLAPPPAADRHPNSRRRKESPPFAPQQALYQRRWLHCRESAESTRPARRSCRGRRS
jgi:condensin complex subunit 3